MQRPINGIVIANRLLGNFIDPLCLAGKGQVHQILEKSSILFYWFILSSQHFFFLSFTDRLD